MRDIQGGKDPQVAAVVAVIATVKPDILVLGGIDWDYDGRALTALQAALDSANHPLPHSFAAQSNRGIDTGFDLDGDGRLAEAEDAIGYGRFTGADSLAVLSRFGIQTDDVRDYTQMLWRDTPGALLPYAGQPDGLDDVLPLSTTAHWLVPVDTDSFGRLWLGTFFATAPVFDGPEDRNGRRNHDEIAFWTHLLDGSLDAPAPANLIIAGHANLDPDRGAGRRTAIASLITDPRLQDPLPKDLTVDWRREDLENMRVSYVLPPNDWQVLDAGVHWPDPDTDAGKTADTASRHRLVWVDVIPH